jgi:hypothetical protein
MDQEDHPLSWGEALTFYRKWSCIYIGKPLELEYQSTPVDEDEEEEPTCRRCGATPSSDLRKTVSYRGIENWDD